MGALRDNRRKMRSREAREITDRGIAHLSARERVVRTSEALEEAAMSIREKHDELALAELVEIYAEDIVPRVLSKLFPLDRDRGNRMFYVLGQQSPALDRSEALQVGREVASEGILHEWDAAKGRSLRSWIWMRVESRLIDLYRKNRREAAKYVACSEYLDECAVAPPLNADTTEDGKPLTAKPGHEYRPRDSNLMSPSAEAAAIQAEAMRWDTHDTYNRLLRKLREQCAPSTAEGVAKGHKQAIERAWDLLPSLFEECQL
jgi:DNA-directed RNA polymerase specialized sigma24 family protein